MTLRTQIIFWFLLTVVFFVVLPVAYPQIMINIAAFSDSFSSYNGPVHVSPAASNNGSINNIDGVSVNGVYNVKDPFFGATCNTTQDDAPAINKAINTACTAGSQGLSPTVLFPPTLAGNACQLNEPIVVACANTVRLQGAGSSATLLKNYNASFDAPIIVGYPSTYVTQLGTITAASLATGSGNSLSLSSSQLWYLIVNDVLPPQVFNGLTAWTFEGYINYQPVNAAHNYALFASGGNDGANPNTNGPITNNSTPHILISLHGTDNVSAPSIDFYMDIQGTITHLNVASGSSGIAVNTPVHFGAVLDPNAGSPVMRLFVGGTQVGSVSATGGTTIKQLADETMTIGAYQVGPTQFPDSSSQNEWIGKLDSIRISKSARYTANFTAPTVKFTTDANTLFLDNFSNVEPLACPSCPATALIGTDTPSGGYLVIHSGTNATQGAGLRVDGIQTSAGSYGIITIAVPGTFLSDVNIQAAQTADIYLSENSYSSRLDHPNLLNSNIGIATVDIADANVRDYQDTGSTFGYIAQTGARIYGQIITPANTGLTGLSLGCQTATCDYDVGVALDVENGGSAVPMKLWSTSAGNFNIEGTELQNAATSNLPGIYVNTFGTTGNMGIALAGVHYDGGTAPGEVVHFLSTTNPVSWAAPVVNGIACGMNTIPLFDAGDNNFTVTGCPIFATLSGGTATITNGAISSGSICSGKDLSSPSSSVSVTTNNGGAVVTGNGTDRVKLTCW